MARHNRKWDGARSALKAIRAQTSTTSICAKTALSAAAPAADVSGRREKDTTRINRMRFDQIVVANPETLAVGCPFCMTMMEDAVKFTLDGGKTTHPRSVRVDRRIHHDRSKVNGR